MMEQRDEGLHVRITEEESEVSHYTQDEAGEPKRTMVKKSAASVEDIQRALKKEMIERIRRGHNNQTYLEDTPRSSQQHYQTIDKEMMDQADLDRTMGRDKTRHAFKLHTDSQDDLGRSNTYTSRRFKGMHAKGSGYLEEGTEDSAGSDTLNNMKLLDNIRRSKE